MKDIFNQLYGTEGCFVIKVAQPHNKKTPKAIQEFGTHYEKTNSKTYDAAIKEFKDMSATSYEYSRLAIYLAMEHIQDSLFDLKIGFKSLVSFNSTSDVFVSLFKTMDDYFAQLKTIKKVNKKIISVEVEAVTSYIEGVLFLKEVAKKDATLVPLIAQYEKNQQNHIDQLMNRQQTFKAKKPEYVIIDVSQMLTIAKAEMELSMTFNYSSLDYHNIETIMIDVGSKKEYWAAIQNEEKWASLYTNNTRQSLTKSSLDMLRVQIPLILEQFKTLHHLSFTNMFKALLVTSNYYGNRIGALNEKAPKNETEFNEHEELRAQEIKYLEATHWNSNMPLETQKPEITIENLKFANQILTTSMTVNTLINNVCGFIDSQQPLLILERFDAEYDIVKLSNSDMAILLTKNSGNIHGDLINLTELANSTVKLCMDSKRKGTSFSGMTHFLKEIKEPFVQEYFFGKQSTTLGFIDNRS